MEIYDHLANKETLIIYMTKDEGVGIPLSGGMLTQGSDTRILQDSYDYRPVHKRTVKIGERLTCSSVVSSLQRRILPTDWVVTSVESYEPTQDVPGFREVTIAYCERQPLTLEEFKEWVYDTGVTVSADSFGGDEAAYQAWQDSQKEPVVTGVG
ncbi:hypothetical protein [Neosynechococcus sphagnicola]|uniref:hypothetical protein n=1 Tax=Neosynechococcus sphagnicola TaxID=1501145 RepID=UPI0006922640|nr:hypothetical protein [Neosynechococcus sphagnicola]